MTLFQAMESNEMSSPSTSARHGQGRPGVISQAGGAAYPLAPGYRVWGTSLPAFLYTLTTRTEPR